ncbi:hypothetical protein [Bacillus thuringiensis]|uniref:hypothetical protein n=1 Tax=Bacillus thuringiensis TaxID=1428 RepID=UPI00210043C3|nr:hypothetical protein [Bacillus thuringiensis]
MNDKQYFGMYLGLYLIIMFLVMGNAKSFIQAGIVMVLVIFIAEVDYKHGYYKASKKKKRKHLLVSDKRIVTKSNKRKIEKGTVKWLRIQK